jgi:hypothetical protein
MASRKDVPDFNNLLLEFKITQVNRISFDRNENSANFFRHIKNIQYMLHPQHDTHGADNEVAANLFVACRGQSL